MDQVECMGGQPILHRVASRNSFYLSPCTTNGGAGETASVPIHQRSRRPAACFGSWDPVCGTLRQKKL